jgi:hypothetical protein
VRRFSIATVAVCVIAAAGGLAACSGPGGASPACPHPSYVTSAKFGTWKLAQYAVANDMWNSDGYQVAQTLYAEGLQRSADLRAEVGHQHVRRDEPRHRDLRGRLRHMA